MDLREKIILAALAILCGVYFSAASIMIPAFRQDDRYTPLLVNGVFAYSRDETTYAFLVKDFYEGSIPGDPTLYEHKDRLNIFVPLFPMVLLTFMAFFAGSVQGAFVLGNFVFPVSIFLIVFALLHRKTKNFPVSILAPVFMLIAFDYIVTPPWTLHNISFHIDNILNSSGYLNYFSRIPHIQLTFTVFIASIFLLYVSMEKQKIKYSALCGIVSGLLFYSYLFYWTVFFGALMLNVIYYFAKKDASKLRHAAVILMVFFAVAAPFWLQYMSFDKAFTEDISVRNGKDYERLENMPVMATLKYMFILALFYAVSRKKDYFFFLMGSVMVSGLAFMNSQILTGFSIQNSHYEFALGPIAAIILVYMLWEVSESRYRNRLMGAFSAKLSRNLAVISIILILSLFAVGFYSQYAFAKTKHDLYSLDTEYDSIYRWLNANTEKGSVVLTLSTEQNHLIPLYTHNNVYLPYGAYSLANESEILERLYISYSLLSVPPSRISEMVNNQEAKNAYIIDHRTNTFDKSAFEIAFWNLYLFSLKYSDGFPEEMKERIQSEYYSYYSNRTMKNTGKYRIDYILTGPYERSIGAKIGGIPVMSSDSFDLYKIK